MNFMKINIENVSKKDLSSIHALEKKVFKENAFSKNLLKKLIRYSLLFLKLTIEESHEQMSGFIIILEDDNKRANLANFLINPKYQEKGFGSYLLGKTLEIFKKEYSNYDKIILNVQTKNKKAINLYKKFDFKIKKEIPRYYQSGENSYLMELIF
ncbi:MAG: N-acetyltransferase [Promethearchaeota archaeon]|nr:MAG: N-acetyltransferase [Candidatus Lokiarchaeota archaeon]